GLPSSSPVRSSRRRIPSEPLGLGLKAPRFGLGLCGLCRRLRAHLAQTRLLELTRDGLGHDFALYRVRESPLAVELLFGGRQHPGREKGARRIAADDPQKIQKLVVGALITFPQPSPSLLVTFQQCALLGGRHEDDPGRRRMASTRRLKSSAVEGAG